MTVQHVHVAEGGQAIVGNVSAPAGGWGRRKKLENNPMHWPMHQASRCHAKSKRSGLQCRAPAVGAKRLPDARGRWRGSQGQQERPEARASRPRRSP